MDLDKIYHSYMYSYPHKTAYRPLDQVKLTDYLGALKEQENTLYVHIPFCETKCGYCNLFSIAGADADLPERYIQGVEAHARSLALGDASWNNFVLGGGTPLCLSEGQLERVFLLAETVFSIDHRAVFSGLETSPNQTASGKLKLLKAFSLNRISIGVQSFVTAELSVIRRQHTPEQAEAAIEKIRSIGFPVLNIDLIYGIPGQTMESLAFSLKRTLVYWPEEIFIYPLYIREQTGISGLAKNPDTYKMYWYLKDILEAEGYFQTSMRRFVRLDQKNTESEGGCGFENTISLGCGGRSYVGPLHFCTPYVSGRKACLGQIEAYLRTADKATMSHGIILGPEEQKRRYVIKNLMYYRGISLLEYRRLFNSDPADDFPVFQSFFEQKQCMIEAEWLKLTPLGLSLSDQIGPQLISAQIAKRMKEWSSLND